MALLPIRTVDGKLFTWEKNWGTTEISTLGPGFKFERIYDDACDVGFAIRSQTGNVKTFYLYTQSGNDGNIDYWEFHSLDDKVVVTVFND